LRIPDIKKAFEYLGGQETQNKWNKASEEFMDTQPEYEQRRTG
jgi:L-rhamnose mutarotase